MVSQPTPTDQSEMPRKVRHRRPSRRCKTTGCEGEIKELRRKNCIGHIKRRFSCKRCGLRWTSVERDLPNSIEVEGPHGTKKANQRLAEWHAKQGQTPLLFPIPRDLFSSLET